MTPGPVASGKRLVLHRFAKADITPEYVRWLNDAEVVRFSNQRFRHHDAESCAAYLKGFEQSHDLFIAIRTSKDGRLIGTMTAYVSPQHGTADMGMLIGERPLWGQGLGLEAWSLLMAFLFNTGRCRKVTGGALRGNIGMVKIMERSGMHLEAVRKQQELIDGEPQDLLHFAKFRSD